jgi:methyl-galactoside transport system substrate-binding protein
MKNRSFIAVFFIFLFSLVSCGDNGWKSGIFIYDQNDTFISSFKSELDKDLSLIDCASDIYYASRSQTTQNEQVTQAIESEDYDVLALNLVDRLAGGAIMDKAAIYSLPIVFFNREPLSDELLDHENVYYVGGDPKNEGKLQAELAENLFGSPSSMESKYDKNGDGKIQLVILKGEQGHQDSEERTKNSVGKLRDDGYDIDVLATYYCDRQKDKGYEAFKELDSEKKIDNIELVLSNNDDMALGAIEYLLDEGIFLFQASDVSEQPFPIIGVDATKVGEEAILNNYLYGTVKNNGEEQARAVKRLIEFILKGWSIDSGFSYTFTDSNNKTIYIQGSKITKQNLI